jgi:Dolichyl-phosphate-mannose-protein mannosyltransferase
VGYDGRWAIGLDMIRPRTVGDHAQARGEASGDVAHSRRAEDGRPDALPTATTRPTGRQAALLMLAAVLAVVTLGAGLRAATLEADLPYMTYHDEPFTLMGSARQIANATWDPGGDALVSTKMRSYLYPAFVMNATTVAAIAVSAVRGETDDLGEGARRTAASPYSEVVEPRELVLAGRLVVFTLAVATILLVALLGSMLAGRTVGVLAALLVAVLPVFVTRGSIVIVDTPAACFATAALYCAARVTTAAWKRPLVKWTLLASVASALAFTSKYSSGPALLAVVTVLVLRRDRSVRERAALAVASSGAFVVVSVVVMPALVLRTSDVIEILRFQARVYDRFPATDSLWQQLVRTTEFGLLGMVAALAGLALMLRCERTRSVAIGYLVFAAVLLAAVLTTDYQPIRNILPLLPFLTIAAATAVVACVRFVGCRLRVPRMLQAAGAVVIVCAVALVPFREGTRAYIADQRGTIDTRIQLRRWVSARALPGERVLVAEELSFLEDELRRICAEVTVGSQREPAPLDWYDWVLVGDLDPERWPSTWMDVLPRQETRSIGRIPTSGLPSGVFRDTPLVDVWHRNAQLIHVFGPADASLRTPRQDGCHARGPSVARLGDVVPVVIPATGTAPEGDAGTSELHIPVTLSEPPAGQVSITWQTLVAEDAPAPADPNGDYLPAHGELTLDEGETTATVAITINGDTRAEPDENVVVAFDADTPGVRIGAIYGLGRGVIIDDD